MKRKISNFTEIIGKGLSKPQFKFVFQMIYGLLESNSIKLSDISRALKEDITLKKTIERLSRNLKSFKKQKEIFKNYISGIKKYINNDTIFCIDLSEITKKSEDTKFESLCRVRDGSTGEIRDGYYLCEIAALTENHKMPVSAYTQLYSSEEEGFVSQNDEIFKGLESLSKNFGSIGIRALDRGFDDNKFYNYFLDKEEKFVIRAKKNRNVIHKGKSENILKVANKYKGKYTLDFKDKFGKEIQVKISYIPIKLSCNKDKDLVLVAVYGLGKTPMMLITNMESESKRIAVTIAKVYLMRWRIEEYFKFKKQQFDLEDIRVRGLNSIKTLNLLLTFAVGFIGILSEQMEETIFAYEVIEHSERIYDKKAKFVYYQVARGIYNILKKTNTGIRSFIENIKKEASQRLRLFNPSDFNTSFDLIT